jgi:hypothetical protein
VSHLIGVGSWSGDTPMRALYAGVLGRARSHSIGTEGAEALPRWDPSTSYPSLALNMNYGAPSSF